ncbi:MULTISPECIES: hypothetical protein [unclassified Sphingobium]|uniref:hypothetical protein n=1 Tax=unclassified Sphingobium TaxID=2611147 RepID=UPI002223F071|nr:MULTISPECIES: hypothetical protein [unclassified Sphingobium]MCW2351419.1 hypothetical protein [Sphingobium sp. B12D2B]MCW2370640.1 hypothetical protein [Sphingobium sp. B11D3D]
MPIKLLAWAALFFATMARPAQAAWLEASSENFVIYADQKPEEIKQFSDQLERFHHAMGYVLSVEMEPPSPSNRVTVYVVRSDKDVRRLQGGDSKYTYAFYVPRAGDAFAIVPRVKTSNTTLDMPMLALLHEYAHHYLISTSSYGMPLWFSEGAAEFFASAQFRKNGNVGLGMPARHRAGDLMYGDVIPVAQILNSGHYPKSASQGAAFYGRSWLLYHYLTFSKERPGQLAIYLRLLRSGKSLTEAATGAFGDLNALQRDLDKYLGQSRMTYLELPAATLKPGPVSVRALSEGEAAAMPLRIELKNRPSPEELETLVADLRALAPRYPNDAALHATLAEAELEAGHEDAALAAANTALALDDRQVSAYLAKGKALFRKAESAPDASAAYAEARRPFIELNRFENNHPLPLQYFYRSFLEQGRRPTENAVAGLERAVVLAPFDQNLRTMLVMQLLRDQRYDDALINLGPLAFDPHGGPSATWAQSLRDRIEAHDRSQPLDVDALLQDLAAAQAEDVGDEGGENIRGN